MKQLILFLTLALLALPRASAGNAHPIELEQLPQAARRFLSEYYPDVSLTLAREEGFGIMNREYEVVLSDGTRIEFRGNGQWEQVDSRYELPRGITPREIATYVARRFPREAIVGIERSRRHYEVKLISGAELTFDRSFRLIDIDD